MKKFLFLLMLPLVAVGAGSTANLSWVWPTTYIDGTTIPTTDLKEILIEWRRTASGAVVGSTRVSYPSTTAQVPGLVCGDYVFNGYAVLQSGDQSAKSNNATYATGIKCSPNPPILSVN